MKSIDLDIRSLEIVKTKQPFINLSIGESNAGIGRLLIKDFVVDTLYYIKSDSLKFIFYRESNLDGVLGGDQFVFADSGFAYKIRVSNQLAPDQKNYISVFKYSDSLCVNYEGKASYKRPIRIEDFKYFNVIGLLYSISEIDSSVFNYKKNDYRLTSYLFAATSNQVKD
jgi:hypothetical protein